MSSREIIFGAAGGTVYWMALLGNTTTSSVLVDVAVDSSGNVYVWGFSYATATEAYQIAKYSPSGTLLWQRSLDGSLGDYGKAVTVDSSGNVYAVGYTQTGSGLYMAVVAKYNTSGTLQWQRSLSATIYALAYGVGTDSSGNVYVFGNSSPDNTNFYSVAAKYNSSGTLQWQRELGPGPYFYGGAVDTSGNSYGTGAAGGGGNLTAKYDNSGALQWQRKLASSGYGADVAVDSSGNVYISGRETDGVAYGALIAKYNSSGTLQWQRKLRGTGDVYGYGLAVDSSANVYVSALQTISGVDNGIIAKYNTSGTLQWQRNLSVSGGSPYLVGVSVDNKGAVYIVGNTPNTGLIAKLPDDGSLTGTYSVGGTSITYGTSSLTDSATTYTDSAGTATDAAGTLTGATSTLTDATSSLATAVTIL